MVEENDISPVGAVGASDLGSVTGTWSSIPATVLPPAPPRPVAGPASVTNSPGGRSTPPPTSQQVAAAVDAANAQLSASNRVVQFHLDRATGVPVIAVLNAQTGEVLQQIPGPDMAQLLRMLESWSKGSGGALVDLIA